MEKSKRIKLIQLTLIVGLCIVGLGFSSVLHYSSNVKAEKESLNQNAYLYLKLERKKIKEQAVKPFIKIDGKAFTNKEFTEFQISRNIVELSNGNSLLSDEQIKDEFIQNAVLEEEAEKQNIVVDESEAEKFTKHMRQILKQSSDEYAIQFLQDYLSALGISEDEYWDRYAVLAYKKALKISKLKQQFFNEQKAKTKDINIDELQKAWEKYQQDLVKKAKVEFIQGSISEERK